MIKLRVVVRSVWWVWDLGTLAQFQGSEMSPELFQYIIGGYVKP